MGGFTPVVTRRSRKSSRNSFTEPTKSEIMYDWMIDDVGTIESSDEEETVVPPKLDSCSVDLKVSDSELVKNVTKQVNNLPKPKYASIAAKVPESGLLDKQQ